MKKTPGDIMIFHSVPKNIIQWYTVPEIWCARDRKTDGQTNGKSDLKRWVPHLKRQNKVQKNKWPEIPYDYVCKED